MAAIADLTLSPSKIYTNLERCLKAQLVPLVRSSPGLGKSDLAHDLADAYNLLLLDFRLGQADITDLNGLPRFTKDGRAEFAPFVDFPLEGDELPINPKTGQSYAGWLLFFDELTSAQKQLQAAAYKIILERKVGQRRLHERVLMMAAGNLASDKAVVHDMSTALQSRLVHLEMRLDHKEWMEWAIRKDVDSRILAYVQFRPDDLYNFQPDHNDKTFACPRTWWFANKLVHKQEITHQDLPLLAGTISSGVAHQFIEFVQIYHQLPKFTDIVRDPMGINLSNDPSIKFALSTMLADHVDKASTSAVVQFIRRLPPECRVLYTRMLNLKRPTLIREQAHQDLFIELLDKLK